MNYILKLHASSGLLTESVVNNRKFYREGYICGHCLGRHGVIQNNNRELSTYVSALKLILKRKEILKKAENEGNYELFRKTKLPKKKKNAFITELLHITSSRSSSTKMKIQQIQPSEVTAFAKQPGLTFSKGRTLKASDIKFLNPGLSKKNLNKNYLKGSLKIEPKLSAVKEEKLPSPHTVLKKENKKQLHSDLIIESKLNFLELGLRTNIQPAKKSKTKLNKDVAVSEDFTFKAVKILPFSTVKIIPASKKQSNSTKLELEQFFIPKVNEKTASLNQNDENSVLTNILNAEPSVSDEKSEDKMVHYLKERSLLPYIVTYSKNRDITQFLKSHLDVLIVKNKLHKALEMFNKLRDSSTWKSILEEKINVIGIYNMLLKACSEEGSWKVMETVTKCMEADKVKFNSESFAHILFCLEKVNLEEFQNEEYKKTEIIKVIHKIINNNISLNDIFAKTKLSLEKTDKILCLLRRVIPTFEIERTIVKLNSECRLLENLHSGPNLMQAHLGNDYSNEIMEELIEEQLALEKNFFIKVKGVYKGMCTEKQKEKVEELKRSWRKQIRDGFLGKLKFSKESDVLKKFNILMYLNSLPVETFVDIMMQLVEELVDYSGGYSPNSYSYYKMLGVNVYKCYQLQKKILNGDIDKTEELLKKYVGWYLDPCGPARNTRQEWQMLSQDPNGRCLLDTKEIKWPRELLIKIGKYLYDIVINEVKFTNDPELGTGNEISVFYSVLRNNGSNTEEEVKCHPKVSNLFRGITFNNLIFPAYEVPMVCPPKPWKASDHGGYLILPTDFVRPSGQISGKDINFNEVPVQQLYATFDALNALQAVPWIINKDVLDVALEVFRSGGSKCLNVPSLPETSPVPLNITSEMSPSERFQEYKKTQEILMQRKNQYGLWCEALYKLSLANHFRNKVFWLPQNCDFRGRVYPVPPHLNHIGSDLFRSLLAFAKGKPLGPKGLDWLKIHTINLTGTHKRKSVKERLEYANVILPEILDSAEKPLTGNKWWTESDEPWQTLAACKEIKNALSSENPETYVSRFPIHQDGSCNGLQHYAALGRDVIGAKSVNLTPCETPQDVYSVVAEIVEQKRAEDAKNGLEVAKLLEGFIERKVVKQTVMTTVYGVTMYGAKLQIGKRLAEMSSFPQEYSKTASLYLSKKTFQSLNQMFCSAKEIQDWFIRCAGEICKRNEYVQWVTPMGLPVIQSYGKKCSCSKQSGVTLIKPDSMKQRNAFPPNFIHSLDSSHMMLTALYCEQVGITFAAIHDCFWTHAIDVDTLNKICREQFISLHSQNLLQNLSDFFNKVYTKEEGTATTNQGQNNDKIFDSVPKKGEFCLDQVLNSVYFFS